MLNPPAGVRWRVVVSMITDDHEEASYGHTGLAYTVASPPSKTPASSATLTTTATPTYANASLPTSTPPSTTPRQSANSLRSDIAPATRRIIAKASPLSSATGIMGEARSVTPAKPTTARYHALSRPRARAIATQDTQTASSPPMPTTPILAGVTKGVSIVKALVVV